jgi:hypothetical protein
MSFNEDKYYTRGRSFNSKGNQAMLNAIEKNAFSPTRNAGTKKRSLFNPELEEMKCGGKVHKMKDGGEQLPMLSNGTPGTSRVLRNVIGGSKGRKGLATPYIGYSGGRWGGGFSGTPESQYGLVGGVDYSLPIKTRDRATTAIAGGGLYGGKFGVGGKGFYSFGSPWKEMAIGTSIPQPRATITAGFDKVRGVYGDLTASQKYPIVDTREHSLMFGPAAGFGFQSKQMIDNPELADPIISRANLQYGLQGEYSRKLGDGVLNVQGGLMFDPISGKVATEERTKSDKVHFSPRANITASYTLPLQGNKVKKLVAKKKEKEEELLRAQEREQEMMERRAQYAVSTTQGESEFVKGEPSVAPLKQYGGEIMELTDEEIQKLRAGGHIVIES